MDTVLGICIPFLEIPQQAIIPPQIKSSVSEHDSITAEINKYLKLGIITEAQHSDGEFISQIFPRPKKSGGVRIILYLKPLNKLIQYSHFKMESLSNVLGLLERNCYMASIDLKDAYFSVNVNFNFMKYLRFFWESRLYEFTYMPNGLSTVPREFTKLLKPVFAHLRSEGLLSVYYLDDTWLRGSSAVECAKNVSRTLNLLTQTGFIINEEKSALMPSQNIQFLGFIINSVDMTVTLPTEKKKKIVSLCTPINSDQTSGKLRLILEFSDTVNEIYDRCCPLRTYKIKMLDRDKPYITSDIKALIKEKHKLQIFLK